MTRSTMKLYEELVAKQTEYIEYLKEKVDSLYKDNLKLKELLTQANHIIDSYEELFSIIEKGGDE